MAAWPWSTSCAATARKRQWPSARICTPSSLSPQQSARPSAPRPTADRPTRPLTLAELMSRERECGPKRNSVPGCSLGMDGAWYSRGRLHRRLALPRRLHAMDPSAFRAPPSRPHAHRPYTHTHQHSQSALGAWEVTRHRRCTGPTNAIRASVRTARQDAPTPW